MLQGSEAYWTRIYLKVLMWTVDSWLIEDAPGKR